MTLLLKFSPKDFDLWNGREAELKKIVAEIHRSQYSEATKCFFKICLKKFYKLRNKGISPRKVSFIKTTLKKVKTVDREDLYTKEEIYKIISQLRNIRDRAYVLAHYEAGARTGELLNVKLFDVRFDDSGDFIKLRGLKNTPDREIQLVESGFYLKEWIKSHPHGVDPYHVKNPNAPLWVKLEQFSCKNCGISKQRHKAKGCSNFERLEIERMTLHNIHKNFREACLKAGIRKRSYRLYNLRHTRITEVSKFLSHQQLCKFAGWIPGSDQFDVYVHLTSEDVNKAIRQQYGLGDEKKEEPLVCQTCWKKSPPNSIECLNCRRPLRIEALQENSKVEQVKEALRLLAELQAEGKLEDVLRLGI